LTLFWASAIAQAGPTLQFATGKSREIDLGRAPQSILLANPNMATVERVGFSNKIRITPKERGSTAIHVQYPDGRETTYSLVVGNGETAAADRAFPLSQSSGLRIAREISRIPGMEAFVEDGKVVTTGKLATAESFLQFQRIVHANPEAIRPQLGIPQESELQIAAAFNLQLQGLGEKNLQVVIANGAVSLHGTPSSESGRERAKSHIQKLFPGFTDATEPEAGDGTVLQMNVRFLEVGRSARTRMGSRLSGGDTPLNMGVTFNNLETPTFQIAPIALLLSALKETNAAREIATPTLLTRSGEKASFLAGGEIPVVAGRN
jgi:Flp pilus assembly secretin CpaC